MAEAEVLVNWQRQRLAEAEVEKTHKHCFEWLVPIQNLKILETF